MKQTYNPNCDGAHCKDNQGVVKSYPLGGGTNAILCQSCWAHENKYRYMRGHDTGMPENWPQRDWYAITEYKAV